MMGGLFSKPKMPPVQEPARMPVENDQSSREAAARERNALIARRGRASTNLTNDTAGGSEYSNTDLGQ
jgi:hypothetical protein